MQKLQFKNFVRNILNEEVKKRSSTDQEIYNRLPEVINDKDYKEITPYKRDTKSKEDLIDDLSKVVKEINKDYTVVWDDHDDISVSAVDLIKIRIIPRWENNYDIEAFTRNEDRIHITGQKWEQVKEFVKINLKETKTLVDKDAEKVVKNREDQTEKPPKELSQENKPKLKGGLGKGIGTEKNKDKNYTEDSTKNKDDLPEKPMKEIKDFKKQIDHKVKEPVKIRKKHSDDKHIVKN